MPTDQVNPYEALVNDNIARRDAQRTATVQSALSVNPDAAGARNRTAGALGLPPAVVAATPEESERDLRLKRINADFARYPSLARHFERQELAEAAHDDTDILGQITDFVGNATSYVMGARKSGGLPGAIAAAPFELSRGFAGLFKAPLDLAAPALDPLVGHGLSTNPLRDLGNWFGNLGADAKATADRLNPATGNLVEDAVSSGIKSAVGNLAALPAGIAAGPAAAMAPLVARTGDEVYLDEVQG